MSRFGIKPENAGNYWKNLQVMLRTVRLKCGYSDDDIAAMLGICRSAYTYYETGKTLPDVVTLVALAGIYKIRRSVFYTLNSLPTWKRHVNARRKRH